jgi:Na+-driven multidrug efflux pump
MPQLDFNTTFPQIFWLITIFFFVYTSLVHFFLPSFIKLLKSRKNIILNNEKELSTLQNNFLEKQFFRKKLVQNNFSKLKNVLEKEFPLFLTSTSMDFTPSDIKIASALYYNTLYYDTTILNSIHLKPNFLNLKI